tara:strand:+ start:795 stop:1022 length:228 start_codon:yes stop_codon:yes gene_type:complete
MPQGKGTYGSKVGRPSNPKKEGKLKDLVEARKKYKKVATPDKKRKFKKLKKDVKRGALETSMGSIDARNRSKKTY